MQTAPQKTETKVNFIDLSDIPDEPVKIEKNEDSLEDVQITNESRMRYPSEFKDFDIVRKYIYRKKPLALGRAGINSESMIGLVDHT